MYKDSYSLVKDLEKFALVLAVSVDSSSGKATNYCSLFVTPTNDGNNAMRRFGFAFQGIETLGIDKARSSRKMVILA